MKAPARRGSQSSSKRTQAQGPSRSRVSRASAQVEPPSSLTSTRAIGARPDHARPSSATGLPSTMRSRVKKSGTPVARAATAAASA